MEEKIKSFDEYFAGYRTFSHTDDDELDRWFIAEAKKIYNALKHPKSIEKMKEVGLMEHKRRYVNDLDKDHSALTLKVASDLAHKYAEYKAENAPETFDMYFEGYKNFDNGGEMDQLIVSDAKKIYEKLKTPEKIKDFREYGIENSADIEKKLKGHHLNITYEAVCECAQEYAEYAEKYCKNYNQQQMSQSKNAVLDAKIREEISGKRRQ